MNPRVESIESDASILSRLQQGDEDALAALYDRYSSLLYSITLRVLHDPAAAEEVLEQVFLFLWRASARYSSAPVNAVGWLIAMARSRSLAKLRQRRRFEDSEDDVMRLFYNFEGSAEQNVTCEQAKMLVAKLSEEQRRAIDLSFFEGLTLAEAAAADGCPPETSKSRLRSALLVLRGA